MDKSLFWQPLQQISCPQALLLGIGLQHKSVDQLEKEIELPSGQLMGLFNRIIRKVVKVTSAEGRVLAHFLPKDAEMLTFGSDCLGSSLSHTPAEIGGFSCNILSQRHP